MTAGNLIRETVDGMALDPLEVSRAPAGGAALWFDGDADPATLTRAVQAVERNTILSYQGEDRPTKSRVALRFDWAPDAPRHLDGKENPRGFNLRTLAEHMGLSENRARRAITGLHGHLNSGAVWKGDPMTRPIINMGAGVLPEAETGKHNYGFYVD